MTASNRTWIRKQDKDRIRIARRRSRATFDLRDIHLLAAKDAWREILRYLPEEHRLHFSLFARAILPLMEKMGHAKLIRREVVGHIEGVLNAGSPRYNTWVVLEEALPMWAIYLSVRRRKIESGEWKRLRGHSIEDFLYIGYGMSAEELAGVLDNPRPKSQQKEYEDDGGDSGTD